MEFGKSITAITIFASILFCKMAAAETVVNITLIPPSINFNQEFPIIEVILKQPEEEIDLALAKLVIDKMADPSIDIQGNLNHIDGMVKDINSMYSESATSSEKLLAMMQYIYQPGEWNSNKPFTYNLDDPLGRVEKTKLLPNFLETKKGNCVSMPTLLVILGERLNLDVSFALAPTHLFIRFQDGEGQEFNIEATSGGTVSNDRFLKEFPITTEAVENKVYLSNLTKKEAVTVWVNQLAAQHRTYGDFDKVMKLTDLSLQYHPQSVEAMLLKGSAYYTLTEAYWKRYPKKSMIPVDKLKNYELVSNSNIEWFKKAEALGWVEPPKDFDDKYLAMIEQAKAVK